MLFKSPIEYVDEKEKLSNIIIDDLELIKSKDDGNTPMLKKIINPDSCFGNDNLHLWTNYYTQNKQFLKETQILFKENKFNKFIIDVENFREIKSIWTKIHENNEEFISTYNYIEFSNLQFLNKSSYFLEFLSVFNLLSPILSLLTPLFILIIPFIFLFFYLRKHNIPFSMKIYYEIIQKLFGNFSIIALLTSENLSLEKKATYIFGSIFYIFQLYQSFTSCYRYYNNLIDIQNQLQVVKNYLEISIDNINNFKNVIIKTNVIEYKKCLPDIDKHDNKIKTFYNELRLISEKKVSMKKIQELGLIMKLFFELNKSNEVKESIEYTFGFNGYMEHLIKIQNLYNKKQINPCKFNNKKISIKKIYYPSIEFNKAIKNDVKIEKKNIIITGPNAAGKTTILKSVLYNLILSQQVGIGFYEKANIKCYDYFHCYLNIPDTSGRDSLFQAEARRCKDIIDHINNNKKKQHFCIFDELYSGTNPYEAVSSAYGYLNYLNKYSNINYMLTTHYINLCKLMKKNNINKHMKIINKNDKYNYTYKYISGISEIKGGVKVLKDLHYPDEIIKNSKMIINDI
tara:strand:- start:379 stop:2091 length:1713 start_codon:yes stop_codon:yes gene_type:complete